MFCPNCGGSNSIEQNFCRGCGLKLDAIVEAVSEQFPSKEYAELQRRKERLQRVGVACLTIAGIIGCSKLLFQAARYKLELLGPEVLFWSAGGALIAFLLLSVFFFNYPADPKTKIRKKRDVEDASPADSVTTRLIDERPFEPVPSVTEDTTKVLKIPRSHRKK